MNIHQTIRTERLSATRATVYRSNIRMVLALHSVFVGF